MARKGQAVAQALPAMEANPYEMFKTQVRLAGEKLGLPQDLLAIIETPERVLEVSIPVKMDDGHIEVFKGYRVQHPSVRGPCKGGIVCDPTKLSEGELERLTRRYTAMILPLIGPNRDIPAPDVNTNSKTMNWFMDTATALRGEPMYAIVTGKDLAVGGARGRREATGRGVIIVLKEVLARLGKELRDVTVAVQGFGDVGSVAALLLHQAGAKVIGVADISSGLYNPNGLNIPTFWNM